MTMQFVPTKEEQVVDYKETVNFPVDIWYNIIRMLDGESTFVVANTSHVNRELCARQFLHDDNTAMLYDYPYNIDKFITRRIPSWYLTMTFVDSLDYGSMRIASKIVTLLKPRKFIRWIVKIIAFTLKGDNLYMKMLWLREFKHNPQHAHVMKYVEDTIASFGEHVKYNRIETLCDFCILINDIENLSKLLKLYTPSVKFVFKNYHRAGFGNQFHDQGGLLSMVLKFSHYGAIYEMMTNFIENDLQRFYKRGRVITMRPTIRRYPSRKIQQQSYDNVIYSVPDLTYSDEQADNISIDQLNNEQYVHPFTKDELNTLVSDTSITNVNDEQVYDSTNHNQLPIDISIRQNIIDDNEPTNVQSVHPFTKDVQSVHPFTKDVLPFRGYDDAAYIEPYNSRPTSSRYNRIHYEEYKKHTETFPSFEEQLNRAVTTKMDAPEIIHTLREDYSIVYNIRNADDKQYLVSVNELVDRQYSRSPMFTLKRESKNFLDSLEDALDSRAYLLYSVKKETGVYVDIPLYFTYNRDNIGSKFVTTNKFDVGDILTDQSHYSHEPNTFESCFNAELPNGDRAMLAISNLNPASIMEFFRQNVYVCGKLIDLSAPIFEHMVKTLRYNTIHPTFAYFMMDRNFIMTDKITSLIKYYECKEPKYMIPTIMRKISFDNNGFFEETIDKLQDPLIILKTLVNRIALYNRNK